MAARCATEAFSTTCAVHIDDCEGWWLSGCCGSVAEHWRLKPEVSWVQLPATAGFFTFLYFRLITSKFIYYFLSQHVILGLKMIILLIHIVYLCSLQFCKPIKTPATTLNQHFSSHIHQHSLIFFLAYCSLAKHSFAYQIYVPFNKIYYILDESTLLYQVSLDVRSCS